MAWMLAEEGQRGGGGGGELWLGNVEAHGEKALADGLRAPGVGVGEEVRGEAERGEAVEGFERAGEDGAVEVDGSVEVEKDGFDFRVKG